MKTKTEENIVESPLKNKKIVVYPVLREGSSFLQDIHPNHVGAFLFEGSKIRLHGTLYDTKLGHIIDPLTPEEKEFFYNSDLRIEEGTLSIFDKNCYWNTFIVDLTREPVILDLSNPLDYLKYKFILCYSDLIAPSWEERFNKGTYKFAIRDKEYEEQSKIDKITKQLLVMKKFIDIKDSPSKLKGLLSMYYLKAGKTKNMNTINDVDALLELTEAIDKETDTFYDIFTDPRFEEKVFVYQCLIKGKIKRKGASYLIDGVEETMSMNLLLDFLKNPKNQDIKLKLLSSDESK